MAGGPSVGVAIRNQRGLWRRSMDVRKTRAASAKERPPVPSPAAAQGFAPSRAISAT